MTEFLVLAYIASIAFNAWALIGEEKKRGVITRGDAVFITVLSLTGPLGFGAAISALGSGRFENWAKKPIWKETTHADK